MLILGIFIGTFLGVVLFALLKSSSHTGEWKISEIQYRVKNLWDANVLLEDEIALFTDFYSGNNGREWEIDELEHKSRRLRDVSVLMKDEIALFKVFLLEREGDLDKAENLLLKTNQILLDPEHLLNAWYIENAKGKK